MSTGRLGAGDTAIQPTIFDAKADLLTATAADTPARLAVGNNGETLLADSAATTGLRWGNNLGFTAGKNKIINGDFRINQRNFTSNTANTSYNFDRWFQQNVGTYTVTPQTFTLGDAPVAGYEGTTFLQAISSGQSAAGDVGVITQRIEDVRTFANQTVTVSFWAKANTGTPKIGIELVQNFGSGGSPTSQISTPLGAVTLSTSWARYSLSVAVPSISGKTIGTTAGTSYLELNLWTSAGSNFATRASSIGIQNFTAQLWGVQVEAGSLATAFQTATGTLAGELAACQRYYYRASGGDVYGTYAFGWATSTTASNIKFIMPVTMRAVPTSIDYASINMADGVNAQITPSSLTLSANEQARNIAVINAAGTGYTQYRNYSLIAANSGTAYIGVSAEL